MSEGVVQILIGPAAPPLQLLSGVSRKTHGAAGTFDINLSLAGAPTVECRSSRGAHTLVFTFDGSLVSGGAQVGAGTATIAGSPVFAGNTMTLNLSGVTELQTITLMLNNVTGGDGRVLPNTAVNVHVVSGDTNGNGAGVNASDVQM